MNVSTLKSGKFGKFMNVVYAEILLKKNQRNVIIVVVPILHQ